jgi:hypothetical protein
MKPLLWEAGGIFLGRISIIAKAECRTCHEVYSMTIRQDNLNLKNNEIRF